MNQDVHPLVLQRDTINPYRTAAMLLGSRMAWDIRPEAWRSRRLLRASRNMHAGKKAVILCNGPSLLKVDFDLLQHHRAYCFGLNKINLLFNKTSFRPDSIVAVNRLVIDQNVGFYNETDIPLFLASYAAGMVKPRANVAFLHSGHISKFAKDCSVSIFEGATVTFVALQLAYHMGFTEVALVGADHNFAVSGPANLAVVSGEKDESHFDPNYFAGGVKWQLPDLFQSEVSYGMARDVYEANGRRIVNCTDGGKLEIYPRRSLASFLDGRG